MALAVSAVGVVAADAPVQKAHADITGTGVSGKLELTETKLGNGTEVAVSLNVKGLAPGLHGVHFHAVGKCTPDFDAANGHFDPGPAGNTDPDANHPFHMGDLPNLSVSTNGEGTMRTRTNRVTLASGALSLFDADGTAIMIHANPDQGITGQPKSGVSGGPRVACGVIVKG
jgi:Cu-Zn family superoxide dismutase